MTRVLVFSTAGFSNFRDGQAATDFPGQAISNFGMSGNSFHLPGFRVAPQGM